MNRGVRIFYGIYPSYEDMVDALEENCILLNDKSEIREPDGDMAIYVWRMMEANGQPMYALAKELEI